MLGPLAGATLTLGQEEPIAARSFVADICASADVDLVSLSLQKAVAVVAGT